MPVWDPFCRFANDRLARIARLKDTIHQQASNNARNKAWELDIWIFFGRLLWSTTLGRCRRSHEAPTSLPDGLRSMLSHLVGDAFSKQQLRSMQIAGDEIWRSWLSISPIANCQASATPFRHIFCLSPERVVPFEVNRATLHDTWQGKHDHEFGVRLARHLLQDSVIDIPSASLKCETPTHRDKCCKVLQAISHPSLQSTMGLGLWLLLASKCKHMSRLTIWG